MSYLFIFQFHIRSLEALKSNKMRVCFYFHVISLLQANKQSDNRNIYITVGIFVHGISNALTPCHSLDSLN